MKPWILPALPRLIVLAMARNTCPAFTLASSFEDETMCHVGNTSEIKQTVLLQTTHQIGWHGRTQHVVDDSPMWKVALELGLPQQESDEAMILGKPRALTGPVNVRLVRIPKSASSSASVIARRIAGCTPRGPCCDYPGNPLGSCPQRGLMCPNVDGCIMHGGFDIRASKSNLIMTFIRHPISRALSAFFYAGHHPNDCTWTVRSEMEQCFVSFLTSHFSTPTLNQLNGRPAYSVREDVASVQSAIVALGYFDFVGIVEVFDLSVITLFAKVAKVRPLKAEDLTRMSHGTRKNTGNVAERSHLKTKFIKEMTKSLAPEIKLYHSALNMFCSQLLSTGLWNNTIVQEEVKNKSRELLSSCKDAKSVWVS